MRALFYSAIRLLGVWTLLAGLLYPLAVSGIAQIAFPHQANGSLIYAGAKVAGSELIGQSFEDPKYFWSRLSATATFPYNAAASGASNLGPSNPALLDAVQLRIEALRAADPQNIAPIPIDLATASASGLDPHISVAAALYQVSRVARVRSLNAARVRQLVEQMIEGRQFGLLGEPRVNVLKLNWELDRLKY